MRPRNTLQNFIQRLLLVSTNKHKTTIHSPSLLRPLSASTDSLLIKPDPPNPTGSTEFPDLPTWVKNPNETDPDNEDFVIPPLPNWVEKPETKTRIKVETLGGNGESDIDKVSKLLKRGYPSKEMVVNVLNECGIGVTEGLVEQLLKRFSNDWVVALGVFSWAKGRTGYVHKPEVFDSVIDSLGKRKQFDLMWEVVEELNRENGFVSLVTISKVIRRLARAYKYEDAIDVFRGIERFGLEKNVESLNLLMDALTKEGSVEHAYQVFSEYKDSVPLHSRSFNILVHGYCKIRKLDVARQIMGEMEKHGFQPNVITYTCFVEAYCRMKDFVNVEATFREMEEKECKPNIITYTIAMHALGKVNSTNQALEVYDKVKKSGCVPDSSFYSALIYILSRSGRFKDAVDVFEDMVKQGVARDLLTYNTMISSACYHSKEKTAFQLLLRMDKDSCKPNIKTYAPLLKMSCKRKSMKVLRYLLHHMVKNDVSIELGTYMLLAGNLAKNGNIERACSFFEEAVNKGMVPMDSVYKVLITTLERNNMREAKENIEKLMLKAMKE